MEKEITSEYNRYLTKLFDEENNNKNLFSFTKSQKKDQVGIPSEGKSEALSDQYNSVFTKEDTNFLPDKGPSPFRSMGKITVTISGVVKLLNLLNPKKAIGPDMVPTSILKDYAEEVAPMHISTVT